MRNVGRDAPIPPGLEPAQPQSKASGPLYSGVTSDERRRPDRTEIKRMKNATGLGGMSPKWPRKRSPRFTLADFPRTGFQDYRLRLLNFNMASDRAIAPSISDTSSEFRSLLSSSALARLIASSAAASS